MIRLTSYKTGETLYIPADVVIKENYIYELGIKDGLQKIEYKPIDGAMVVYDGVEYSVKESIEEVARKVLEWRLEKDWHHASIVAGSTGDAARAKQKLMELAGLEEPNHAER